MLATAHPGSHPSRYPAVSCDPLNINYDSDNDDQDMQVDSDSDVKHDLDADADGEFVEDDSVATPLHNTAPPPSSSYYPRDSVRIPVLN